MKNILRNTWMLGLGLGMTIMMTSAISPKNPHYVTIKNTSEWAVDHIYISHVSENEWGGDLLGSDEILNPGEEIRVVADCGEYDVKVVDEDGITCVVPGVAICSGEEVWEIGDLTTCDK